MSRQLEEKENHDFWKHALSTVGAEGAQSLLKPSEFTCESCFKALVTLLPENINLYPKERTCLFTGILARE